MIGQTTFYTSGPEYVSGDIFSTNTGNLGSAVNPYGNIYSNTGNISNVRSDSGVFNYLGPTGRFFPPLLTLGQRTGLWSGLASPSGTPYDGLMVYQINSGQNLMIVQSGMWKTVTLT